jgi:UDP-N-acetylmuramoyl-L-alanyl-D-glutamate--2,6-diaminopimelate ligase
VPARDITVLVDYAHSEAALENVCRAVRGARNSAACSTTNGHAGSEAGGRLILVFGCGGDRDKGKRPAMGRVANELADVAIVTSDNPRSEEPQSIIDEILRGMQPERARCIVEPDRRLAIRRAIADATAGDVVLIAGKGHETTQTVGNDVFEFDDRKVAAEALR